MTKARAANRRDQAVHALATPVLATNPLSRPCPKCEAQPWKPCRRWIGGRVCGEDVGGGYWRTLKNVHDDRKQHRVNRTTTA